MSDAERLEVHPSWGNRLDGIEGLRGVAAFSVLTAHAVILLVAGTTFATSTLLGMVTGLLLHGLTLFFVLSGFLLYRPFASAVLGGHAPPRTRDFVRNRVLRIWPAYLVILASAGLVMGVAVLDEHGPVSGLHVGYLTDPVLLLANAFLVQGWFPGTFQTGLSVSWSLVTEVSFYLLLPLTGVLGVCAARRAPRIVAAFLPALLLFAIGLAGRLYFSPGANSNQSSGKTWDDVLFASIVGQGDLFALGMSAAVIVVAARQLKISTIVRLRWLGWAALCVGLLGAFIVGETEDAAPFLGTASASVLVVLLLPFRGAVARLAVRALETLPLRAAGLCSYSIYLWHFPVILFLYKHVPAVRYDSFPGLLASVLWVSVPTVLLSVITYRYIELPAMRLKARSKSPATITGEPERRP